MHDTFLQDVIGALMFIDTFYDVRSNASGPELERWRRRGLLRKAIGEVRDMISGLRPPIIDEQGIVAAIEFLVNEARGRGLDVKFTSQITAERLAPTVEAALFRIVQECWSMSRVTPNRRARGPFHANRRSDSAGSSRFRPWL